MAWLNLRKMKRKCSYSKSSATCDRCIFLHKVCLTTSFVSNNPSPTPKILHQSIPHPPNHCPITPNILLPCTVPWRDIPTNTRALLRSPPVGVWHTLLHIMTNFLLKPYFPLHPIPFWIGGFLLHQNSIHLLHNVAFIIVYKKRIDPQLFRYYNK